MKCMQKFKNSMLGRWLLALVLTPIIFVGVIIVMMFILIAYDEIFTVPSGEYKEIANFRQAGSDESSLVIKCFQRNNIAYRVVDRNLVQVRESILRKAVIRCSSELSVAHRNDRDTSWTRTYQFWGR